MKHILSTLSHWALPQRCLLCDQRATSSLCNACWHDLPWLKEACLQCALPIAPTHGVAAAYCGECLRRPPSFDHSVAAFCYEQPLNQLITQFKYHRDLQAGKLLATGLHQQLMASANRHALPTKLIPVPLHWRRQLARGFNQSAFLAEQLSRATGIPLHQGVKRVLATPKQQALTRRERLKNLNRAFQVKTSFADDHVAIVDDVMTTTSTAQALSQALKKAGAARVDIWCIARTPSSAGTKPSRKG